MRATIGRIVHYHDEGGPYPGIVTGVHDIVEDIERGGSTVVTGYSIDLVTFGDGSIYFKRRIEEYVGPHSAPNGTWTWPPREGASPGPRARKGRRHDDVNRRR